MFDLTLLSTVGEITTAIATLGTIGYLAIQMRMSNKLARSQLEHLLNSRVNDRRLAIALDPQFSTFLSKDWGDDKFNKGQRVQISQYVTMMVMDMREVFVQHQMGLVTDGLRDARINVLKMGLMSTTPAKAVWSTYRQLLETDFIEFFENQIYGGQTPDISRDVHPLTKTTET